MLILFFVLLFKLLVAYPKTSSKDSNSLDKINLNFNFNEINNNSKAFENLHPIMHYL